MKVTCWQSNILSTHVEPLSDAKIYVYYELYHERTCGVFPPLIAIPV